MEGREPDWTFGKIILEGCTIGIPWGGIQWDQNRVPESKKFLPNHTLLLKDEGVCSINDTTVEFWQPSQTPWFLTYVLNLSIVKV